MCEETKFSVLCSLFTWIQRSRTSAKKRSKFRIFLDTFCINGHQFSAIRLILPNLDRERGSYGLKESVLATCLIDALGMSRESEDALRLINWRKGGAKTGANAGNFAMVAAEVSVHCFWFLGVGFCSRFGGLREWALVVFYFIFIYLFIFGIGYSRSWVIVI